jgi:hypothetical protein
MKFKLLATFLISAALVGCMKSGYQSPMAGDGDLLIIGGTAVVPDPIAKSVVGIKIESKATRDCEVENQKRILTGTKRFLRCPTPQQCSGVIIGNSLALTAAHCFRNDTVAAELTFGNDVEKAISIKPVTKWIRPLEYEEIGKIAAKEFEDRTPEESRHFAEDDNFDVALVGFDGGLPTGFFAAELLNDAAQIQPKKKIIVAGYGVDHPLMFGSIGILRVTSIPVINPHSAPHEFQADISHGSGTCSGDSGGPAFMKFRDPKLGDIFLLAGITSRSTSEANKPDCSSIATFSNIPAYKEIFSTLLQSKNWHDLNSPQTAK